MHLMSAVTRIKGIHVISHVLINFAEKVMELIAFF